MFVWIVEVALIFFCHRWSTGWFNKLYDFSVTIPGCYKDGYVNNFFLAQLGCEIVGPQNVFFDL